MIAAVCFSHFDSDVVFTTFDPCVKYGRCRTRI